MNDPQLFAIIFFDSCAAQNYKISRNFAVQDVLLKRINRSMKSINNEERGKRDLTCMFFSNQVA